MKSGGQTRRVEAAQGYMAGGASQMFTIGKTEIKK